MITLRDVVEGDLPTLFEHQQDSVANEMAAFPPRDWETFQAHWRTKVLGDDAVTRRAVLCDGRLAGHLVCFEQSGRRLVGYWIGREYWGRGIATAALRAFLTEIRDRPVHAYVAKHNAGSIRVLEKCGFTCSGEQGRPEGGAADNVEEFVFTLTT